MRLSVVLVRFGLPSMEDDVLCNLVRATVSKEWGLRVVDNWRNPETLMQLWNRVTKEEAAAGADAVCFLNSDCWVGTAWDGAVVAAFGDPKVGVVGPQSNMGPQTAPSEVPVPLRGPDGWPDPASVNRAARTCQELWGAQFRESEVYGHCYAVRMSVLRQIGWLDKEIADGYEFYGGEQALSARVRAAGYKVGVAMGGYCFHVGAASGMAAQEKGLLDLEAMREKGRRLFFGNSLT